VKQKKGPLKRWRSKEAREIASVVERAGGTVELTGKGHLRVAGPAGIAIVASAPDTGHQGGRALANTWTTIERETGLAVAPSSARSRPAGKERPANRSRRPPQRPQERHGEVTKWNAGDTCGFITSSEGQSWFVSRDSLPDGLLELPLGTRVAFSGSPKPKIGKPYSEALRIRVTAE
jgi:cold shock CspA family protein